MGGKVGAFVLLHRPFVGNRQTKISFDLDHAA